MQLIPAEVSGEASAAGGGAAYEYEPDEEAILAELLPRNLSVQIFRALLENAASEQGAKMTAMDNATRNAGDMIDRYTLELQPHASGADHQGTDRNHLGRRGALRPTPWRGRDYGQGHAPTSKASPGASPRSSAPSSTCSSTGTCPRS